MNSGARPNKYLMKGNNMGKYVYVYYGGDSETGGTAEEWGAWFGKLGSKLIDGGNQFASGAQAVNKDGVMAVDKMPATGYSIIEAENIKAAVETAKGCPLTQSASGAICVYEALPM
jgi:hypothetical protein